MKRHLARRLTTLSLLALTGAGLLAWSVVIGNGWVPAVLLGFGLACAFGYAYRLLRILRNPGIVESVTLVLLAPLLPRRDSMVWLPELQGQLHEVAADPARWRAIRFDALRSMPSLLVASWGGVLRDGLVLLAVRFSRPRVVAVSGVLQSPDPPWPLDGRATRQLSRRLASLHRCARLLAWSARGDQESEMIRSARRLVDLCAATRRNITAAAPGRRPGPRMVVLLLRVRGQAMILADELLGYRRPGG